MKFVFAITLMFIVCMSLVTARYHHPTTGGDILKVGYYIKCMKMRINSHKILIIIIVYNNNSLIYIALLTSRSKRFTIYVIKNV